MRRLFRRVFATESGAWINQSRVMQMWRRATGRQRAFAMVGLVALFGLVLAPIALQVHASQQQSANEHPSLSHIDPRAAAQRFQQLHFGKNKPAATAYQKALQQAAKLPRSPLGTASRTSSSHGLTTPATVPGTWLPLGPQPLRETNYGAISGEITGIAVDPSNANNVWVGASLGGVWHTTDGGTSWHPMTDTQATMAIGSLAIDPTNPNIVYAGTGDANSIFGNDYPGLGVLKTADSGKTWTLIDSTDFAGLAIGRIAVDPANPQILLLSAGWDGSFLGNSDMTGIWRSINGGSTWTQTLSDPGQLFPDAGTDVVFDPGNPNIVYAGLGNLWALNETTASGVYRSTDNGQTWTQITALPTGSDVERVSLAISPDGTHLYVALTDGDYRDYATNEPSFGGLLNGVFYASADSGLTWTATNTFDTGTHYWWYASFIAVDPSDHTGNTVYAGSYTPHKSTDGGASWSQLPLLLFQHTLAFVNGSSSSFYLGTEGGIWSGDQNTRSTGTYTGNFVDRNGVGPNGLAIGSYSSGSISTVGSKSQLYASSPGWSGVAQYPAGPVGTPAQWPLVDPYALSSTTAALVDYTNNATVYDESVGNAVAFDVSTNGGSTWLPVSQSTSTMSKDTRNYILPFVMSPTNPTELFEATDRVYRNFWPISPVLDPADPCASPSDAGCVPLSALAVAATDDNTIYAGDDAGTMYATTDGGTSWNELTAPCATCGAVITSLAVDPTRATTVYATLSDYAFTAGQHVFKSIDSGTTWTDISTTLPDAPFMSLAVDPANASLLVASSDAGIFASEDAGATWGQLGTGLPNVLINQVFFSHSGDGIFVATDGRGVWRLTYAHLNASPGSISATTTAGVSPSDQTLTIQNTGVGSLDWTLNSSLPSWLSVSPKSGSVPIGGTQPLTLHFNIPPSDPAQTYSTTLIFTDPAADNAPLTVPVTVTAQTAHIQVAPSAVNLIGVVGVNPGSQALTLTNTGNYELAWSSNSMPSWVSVSPTSGTLTEGASQPLTLTFSITDSMPQSYATSLVLTAPATDNSPVSIPITVDVKAPGSKTWYFAEGYTGGNATEYLTLANPTSSLAHVTVKYLLEVGGPEFKTYEVGASQRSTVVVNNDVGTNQNVSMVITSDQPIVAERPYYVTYTGGIGRVSSGTDVLGATSLAQQFDFANLDTSANHETWLTILNPSVSTMHVSVSYFPAAGGPPVVITHTVSANGRGTIFVNGEAGLAHGIYSALVTLDQPGLVERPLYQTHDSVTGYPGAADVVGVAQPLSTWYFAEGFTSPTVNERYILANPTTAAGTVSATVTLYKGDGSSKQQSVALIPGQQVVVSANVLLGSAGVDNSAVVTADHPILAERVMSQQYIGSAGCCNKVIHATGLSEVLGSSAPSHLALFAEGYTGGQVAEYLTIENPSASQDAHITVSFLPDTGGAPTVKVYPIAAHSRFTLYTNTVMAGKSFAMTVISDVPVVAERPMSFIYNGFAPGSTDIIGYQPQGG